jgi:hypothetical protein
LCISAILAITLFVGYLIKNSVSNKKTTISRLNASYSINTNDLTEIVGDADYVFVAYVNKELNTIYKHQADINDEGLPYTNYSITVIDNIKGNLKKNTEIDIQKAGGLSKDGTTYFLYENDELLKEGKYYIISAYAQTDGLLLISGPNSSLMLKYNDKDKIFSSDECILYIIFEPNYK